MNDIVDNNNAPCGVLTVCLMAAKGQKVTVEFDTDAERDAFEAEIRKIHPYYLESGLIKTKSLEEGEK